MNDEQQEPLTPPIPEDMSPEQVPPIEIPEEKANFQFKVLTFNVFKFDGEVDRDVILQRILDLEPDLIGFQEVDHVTNIVNLFGILNLFSAREKLTRFLEPNNYYTKWDEASGPNVVFTVLASLLYLQFDGLLIAVNRKTFEVVEEIPNEVRREPKELSRYPIGFYANERRIIQHSPVILKFNGLEIDFFNTHLTPQQPTGNLPLVDAPREVEALKAGRFVADSSDVSQGRVAIIVGDFNFKSPSPELGLLNFFPRLPAFPNDPQQPGANLVDTYAAVNDLEKNPGNTVDRDKNTLAKRDDEPVEKLLGTRRIDYIFVRQPPANPPLRIVSSQVVLTEQVDGENFSDHYGLLTTFETNP